MSSILPMTDTTTIVREENENNDENNNENNIEQKVRDILIQLQNVDVPIEYRTIDNDDVEDTAASVDDDDIVMNDDATNDTTNSSGINNDNSNNSTKKDNELLDRYMIARDEYMARRMKVLLLEHVKTYNGTSFTLPPEYVSQKKNQEENQAKLKVEIDTKINQVQTKSQQIHTMKQQLHTLYNQLQTKQQYYQSKINEYDHIQVEQNSSNNKHTIITESIVQEQDSTIQSLQLKHTTIKEQLKSVREQNTIIQQQLHTKKLQQQQMIQKYRNKVNGSSTDNNNNTMLSLLFNNTNTNTIPIGGVETSSSLDDNELVPLQQLKDIYNNMKDKLTTYQQAQDMYTNLRTVLETIYQLKIISIEPIQSSTSASMSLFLDDKENNNDMSIINNSNNASSSNNMQQKMIKLTIEIFHKHIVQICIRSSINSEGTNSNRINTGNDIQVDSATLMSDSIIKGQTSTSTAATATPAKLHQPIVQMKIPKFDDIIQYAKTLRQQQQNQQYSTIGSTDNYSNSNLKFVIQEIMSRCLMIEQRVQILSQLQNIVLTQIGNVHTTSTTATLSSDNFTTYTTIGTMNEQEVICSFNDEQITVLLKLRCDCPFTNNSVSIDQLVGFGGWDQDELDIIKDSINNNNISTDSNSSIEQLYNNNPVTVIVSLQKKIHDLLQQKQQHSQQQDDNHTTSAGTPNDHDTDNYTKSKVIFPPTPALPNKKKQRRIPNDS